MQYFINIFFDIILKHLIVSYNINNLFITLHIYEFNYLKYNIKNINNLICQIQIQIQINI